MSDRVLVADDDPDILNVVKINFELDGFEVDTAVDGEDALQKAMTNPPNAIVLDIMMPRMDGLTALHRLRSQAATANIPIILLTARGLPEDRVRGLELGADDYITKPFDITELAARVRAVLRRTQSARDLSPLTGLPGNFRITAEVESAIQEGRDFALVHGDLDNFKAFNDHYGFMRGDEVIRFCASSFTGAVETLDLGDAFVGHIGGDDFVAIVPTDMAESFCKEVIERRRIARVHRGGRSPGGAICLPGRFPVDRCSVHRRARHRYTVGGIGDRCRDERVRQETAWVHIPHRSAHRIGWP
jgi:DNA-binding response OmpR family regulator